MGHNAPEAFGTRIRRLRRSAGYGSRDELAAAIRNPNVSAAVIKNIEAGRKADISIVHLFEIAYALHVSPLVLLFDFARPYRAAHITGLGPNFEGATNIELDEWLTEPTSYAPLAFASDDYRERLPEVHQMFAAREHRIASMATELTVANVQKALRDKEIDNTYEQAGESKELEQQHFDRLRAAAHQSEQLFQSIKRNAEQLGVDLTADA